MIFFPKVHARVHMDKMIFKHNTPVWTNGKINPNQKYGKLNYGDKRASERASLRTPMTTMKRNGIIETKGLLAALFDGLLMGAALNCCLIRHGICLRFVWRKKLNFVWSYTEVECMHT